LDPGDRHVDPGKYTVLRTADTLIQIDLSEVAFSETTDKKLTISGHLNLPDEKGGATRRIDDSQRLLTEVGLEKEAAPPKQVEPPKPPPKPFLSEVIVTFETLVDDKDEGDEVHVEILAGDTICCQDSNWKDEQWEDKNPGSFLRRHPPKNNPKQLPPFTKSWPGE
jgi:hypothetical protein